jgi:hypothetical protein
MRQIGKGAGPAEARNCRHKAVEQNDGAQIDIFKIESVGLYEKAADKRRKSGYKKHRLFFDELFYLIQGKISFAMEWESYFRFITLMLGML